MIATIKSCWLIIRYRGFWRWLLDLPRPCYVVIYDKLDDDGQPATEEYYGYFADPAEARAMWQTFSEPDPDGYRNVMLCRVVERWPTPNERRFT